VCVIYILCNLHTKAGVWSVCLIYVQEITGMYALDMQVRGAKVGGDNDSYVC
jgi:hypothetical protein